MRARAVLQADRETARPTVGGPVMSRVTTSAPEAVCRFQAPSSGLGKGLVNLISLDALAERMAETWQGRREQVYDVLERTLDKRLGENGFHLRVSETEYLVALPDFGLYSAQTACLRTLGEVLKHFFGVAAPSDLRVRQVRQIDGRDILSLPLNPVSAMEGGAQEARDVETAARLAAYEAEAEADPTLLATERWSPFVGAHGRRVRVSCNLEPVLELRGNSRIGYRLNRRVIDVDSGSTMPAREVANLSRADHLRIDMATIARGMARLEADGEGEQALSLIIPVSYYTLSHHEGRRMLSQAFARARKAVLKGVLCEVCDIEGVPQGALTSAVSLIRPWSLFVIGHLTDETPRASPMMREAGIQAISFDCPGGMDGDAEFLGWLRDSIRSSQKAAKTTLIYGCSPRRIMLAGMMGATHASVAGAGG